MDQSDAVNAYLAAVPEPHRELLAHVRAVIQGACPEATETISYGMPAFERDGRKLVWFAAFKRHCSLFPANAHVQAALGEELTPFLGEKATIRFSAQNPIPDALVRRLVAVRLAEVAGAGA
jgi:uncharacterized protein YdhG (YjbR/CyaY superfamily)